MTPTNDQIVAEAQRRRDAVDAEQRWPLEDYVIDVVREGWTPPKPVDPDLLAFREWMSNYYDLKGWSEEALASRLGHCDGSLAARAFLAGARMASEQERERAKVLVRGLENISDPAQDEISRMALNALAKYRGDA